MSSVIDRLLKIIVLLAFPRGLPARSADFHSAVSRISNPHWLGLSLRYRLEVGATAGWKTCAPSAASELAARLALM